MGTIVYLAEPDADERRWLESALRPCVDMVQSFDSVVARPGLLHCGKDACLIVGVQADDTAVVSLVRELRGLGNAIPVIALVPNAAFRTALNLARIACTDFLERPVTAIQLRAAVRRACSRTDCSAAPD